MSYEEPEPEYYALGDETAWRLAMLAATLRTNPSDPVSIEEAYRVWTMAGQFLPKDQEEAEQLHEKIFQRTPIKEALKDMGLMPTNWEDTFYRKLKSEGFDAEQRKRLIEEWRTEGIPQHWARLLRNKAMK